MRHLFFRTESLGQDGRDFGPGELHGERQTFAKPPPHLGAAER
jgi:hypothetical protein